MSEVNVKSKECVHYWIIEPPDGPVSKGQCKYCGIVTEFFNRFEEVSSNVESSNNSSNRMIGNYES